MSNEIKLEISAEIAAGKYCNFAIINHTANEFMLDFAHMLPGQTALVTSRVITSPRHAKALLQALAENIAKYEAQFGAINDLLPVQSAGSSTPTN